jgi:Domain of unknown function (DUF4249)
MKWRQWVLLLIVLGACKDKYVADVHVPATGFLVVEGYINASDTTDIMLSRTSGLDSVRLIPEPGAQLEIQSQNGTIYPLFEKPGGHYSINAVTLDPGQQYRLHIRTANGREYLSDSMGINISPPIDSVNWAASAGLITIYVSTHDNQHQPGYYQWQFEETWKYTAAYGSILEYRNDMLIPRPDSDQFYTCWRSDLSTNVVVTTSEKLTNNVIYQYPVTQVDYTSTDKLNNRYSILVKQIATSREWYEWNVKIKKNTEQLGTIFDAQPSETGGNLHCTTDPTEQVIGFVGISTRTEKRIFIDRYDIPPGIVFTGYAACEKYSVSIDPQAIKDKFGQGFYTPIDYLSKGGVIVGVEYAGPECVDCRLKGGTTIEPSFWQ